LPIAGASVLILGGRSEIGLAIARRFAEEGARIALAIRAPAEGTAEDFREIGGQPAAVHALDVLDVAGHGAFLDRLVELPDFVVCAVGLAAPADDGEESARLVMETNYLAPALLLGAVARRMAARDRGCIIGLSSVAGERGRASNYVYGSAKAGFTAFLSGLRARLSRTGVRVITVKPGFVATRATLALKPPRLLTAAPSEVADAVLHAVRSGRDVVYVRRLWRPVMGLIRLLPESVFRKLRI
jgi:NAD(P)-dependent dehydrogenase (short-subunit alcohol dehydrogenase family)